MRFHEKDAGCKSWISAPFSIGHRRLGPAVLIFDGFGESQASIRALVVRRTDGLCGGEEA
jgi:hypothetical protein